MSRLRDPLPGDEHVERGALPDVRHGLLVRDHGEVVAVALQDLVVDAKAGVNGGALLGNGGDVDALKCSSRTSAFQYEGKESFL